MSDDKKCILCDGYTGEEYGGPHIVFKGKHICSSCYINLLPRIFSMKNAGDGGLIVYIIQDYVHQMGKKLVDKKNRSKTKRYIYDISKIISTEDENNE